MSSRKSIQHLYSLNKPDVYSMDFFTLKEFAEELSKINGIIEPGNTTVSEKVDGSAIFFGKEDGKFYMESSHSGKVFKAEDFEDGSHVRYPQHPLARKAFRDNFDSIFALVGHTISDYNNVRIQAEWFYTPMAKRCVNRHGYVLFIETDYIKAKLGRLSTFVVIDAPKEVQNRLLAINTVDVKFLSPKISSFLIVDLSKELQQLQEALNIVEEETDIEALNQPARKKEDRQRRNTVLESIERHLLPLQESIYHKIYNKLTNGTGILGDIEGFVVTLGHITFKVNNPQFMKRKFNL